MPVVCFSDVILTKVCNGTLVLGVGGPTRLMPAIVLATQDAEIFPGGTAHVDHFVLLQGKGAHQQVCLYLLLPRPALGSYSLCLIARRAIKYANFRRVSRVPGNASSR